MRFSCFIFSLVILLQPLFVLAADLSELQGYDASKAVPEFTQAIHQDKDLYRQLAAQPQLVLHLMARPELQRQLATGKISVATIQQQLIAHAQQGKKAPIQLSPQAAQKAAADLAAFANGELRKDIVMPSAVPQTDAIMPVFEEPNTDAEEKAQLALQQAANTPLVPATPDVALPPLIDMNAVPARGQDALGWPQYLNVPEHCAPPATTHRYVHTFYALRPESNEGFNSVMPEQPNLIRSWLRASGVWMHYRISEREIYAVPFVTPNDDAEITLQFENVGGTSWAFSTCPGDFQPAAPACLQGVGGADSVSVAVRGHSLTTPLQYPVCTLQPGQPYFLNMRVDGPIPGGVVEQVFVSHRNNFAGKWPPYTGPGVQQEPYPLNYGSVVGNMSRPDYEVCVAGKSYQTEYRCVDPEDRLQPLTYAYLCQNGQGRFVNQPAPAWHKYVCGSHICYRELEGLTKTSKLSPDATWGYTQQCQFLTEAKRYAWMPVDVANGLVPSTQPMALPARETCAFRGQEYAIGTKRTMTCERKLGSTVLSSAQMTSECRKVAEKRHSNIEPLPVFTYVSGTAFYDPETAMENECTFTFE